jgi:L-alanine-DL-glutamate epimerase-like enolase superfamily enzyme
MQVREVRVDHYDIPLPVPVADSTHGQVTHFALVTVRVRTDAGAEGLGYTYTVGRTGGGAIRMLIERDLAGVLLGADPRLIEQLWQRMWWRVHYVGRGGLSAFAISAVDTALWDLKARLAEEPLWRLLGGHSKRVLAYAGGIDLDLTPEALAERARRNLARGFRAIKIKAGRANLGEDVERVAAVREAIGPQIPLLVDANMRWTAEQAIRASRALAAYDVYWLEEPTIPDDLEGHVRIAREGPLPLAAGENCRTVYEFQKLIASGAVAFPEPDLSNVGGITAWMKVAHLAEAHNLPVTSHGVHELHVHLLAAIPNASLLEVHGFGLESYLRQPLVLRDGYVEPPDRPGHGVAFDWDKLEPYRA